MSAASRPVRIAVCLLVTAGLVVPLSGCSSPAGKMTCSEFNDLSLTERSSKLSSLLEEHNLRATDPDNIMGVTSAVESFCSSSSRSTPTAGERSGADRRPPPGSG